MAVVNVQKDSNQLYQVNYCLSRLMLHSRLWRNCGIHFVLITAPQCCEDECASSAGQVSFMLVTHSPVGVFFYQTLAASTLIRSFSSSLVPGRDVRFHYAL